MRITNKDDIKIGQRIYFGYDDRPFDGYGYEVGIVTKIYDDHYLFDIEGCKNVWGLFDDDDEISVANFTTEEEVRRWLGYV